MQSLIIYERPNLVQPYLVMGLEGWPDAGRVSSGVVGYLKDKLGAKKFAEVKDEQVSKAIEEKAELKDYVRRLEEEYSKGKYEAGKPLGEDIIKEVEDFLRKKRGEE